MNFDIVVNLFNLNILGLILNEIYLTKEITTALLTASKNVHVVEHFDIYEPVWFITSMMVGATELQHRPVSNLTFLLNFAKKSVQYHLCHLLKSNRFFCLPHRTQYPHLSYLI